ncbi:MAG: D-sedoheptulose 7-phosphate isomerase [Candidatus Kappaea frigidicola]|nr:D-sedoheptulose 7-phosphate isomerase [Candidatus Kappaea frigidicola]
MKDAIKKHLEESLIAKEDLLKNQLSVIEEIAQVMTEAVNKGKKIIIFGNGGSAADAQHMAAELVGRYKKERKPIAAIALSTNTSNITAIANDYGFENIFLKQLQALGQEGDIALGISTSGNSPNVIKALRWANENGLITFGLSSKDGGELKTCTNCCLSINSNNTPIVQEAHISCIHILCDIIESHLNV